MTTSDPKARCLASDIWVYPGAMPDDLCDDIIERYQSCPADRTPPTPPYDNRECEVVKMSCIKAWSDLDVRVQAVVRRVLTHHYTQYSDLSSFSDEGYEVCCYEPGQTCQLHRDGTVSPTGRVRLLSLVAYLNDCPDGPVVFPRQDVRVAPKKGLIAVWPPHMTHPHYTLASRSKRYALITWSAKSLG